MKASKTKKISQKKSTIQKPPKNILPVPSLEVTKKIKKTQKKNTIQQKQLSTIQGENSDYTPSRSLQATPNKLTGSNIGTIKNKKGHNRPTSYKKYTEAEKETILQFASINGDKAAAVKEGISVARINNWKLSFEKEQKIRGRKVLDPEMEDKLIKRIEEYAKENQKYPERLWVRNAAKEESTIEGTFKGSKGWYDKFAQRKRGDISRIKSEYCPMVKKGTGKGLIKTRTKTNLKN